MKKKLHVRLKVAVLLKKDSTTRWYCFDVT